MEKVDFKGFEIKNCQLKHEEFVQPARPNKGTTDQHSENLNWERRGFCPKIFRDKYLACAHSLAWYHWMEDLKRYPHWFENKEVQSHLHKMDHIRTAIFKLDHKKGELEKKKILNPAAGDQKATLEIKERYDILIKQFQEQGKQLIHHFEQFHQD